MFIPYCLGSIFKNPNYIKTWIKIVGETHENVVAIWDELIKKVQP